MGALLESARRITGAKMLKSITPRVLGTLLETMARKIETLETNITVVPSGTVLVLYFDNVRLQDGTNTIIHNRDLPTIAVYIEIDGLWTPWAYKGNTELPNRIIHIEYMTELANESRNIKLLLGEYSNR